LFNPDGQALLKSLKRRDLIKAFDFNGTYDFSKMLEDQIKGQNDSWAIRWYASAFLAGKLTLYPGRSLVNNIGHDSSGTHCVETEQFDSELNNNPIDLTQVKVEVSQTGMLAFEEFFLRTNRGTADFFGNVFKIPGLSLIKQLAKDWLPPTFVRWIKRGLLF
jgi:hypothetical protein